MVKLIVILSLMDMIQIETYVQESWEACERAAELHNMSSTKEAPVTAYCTYLPEEVQTDGKG